MERLTKGTQEYLYVDVTDRLNNLTTLDGLTLGWSVMGDEAEAVSSGAAQNDGMLMICGPINTTTLDPDEYALFVTIAISPEIIKLGPFPFVVN